MHVFQREFLELALARRVLRFGDFTLKSGRASPYFFNAGLFDQGSALAGLGSAYAAAIAQDRIEFDMLFGPAYKGIALAVTTAIALAAAGRDIPVAFNRKEAKDHGEAGVLIGAALERRVLIVDDVITAGTSVRESVALIRANGAVPAGVLVALDRRERGSGSLSAAQEVERDFGIPVHAIAGLDELLDLAGERHELVQYRDRLAQYRARYGALPIAPLDNTGSGRPTGDTT